MITPLSATLAIPAIAVLLLAIIPGYRIGAVLNMLASGLTFMAGVALLFVPPYRSDILIIDDFNIYLVILTTFVAFTTSIFSSRSFAFVRRRSSMPSDRSRAVTRNPRSAASSERAPVPAPASNTLAGTAGR